MRYTYEQYEAFFFLHRLLPIMQTKRRFKDTLWGINEFTDKGFLISFDTKKCEKNRAQYITQMLPKFLLALKKQGDLYLEQPKPNQQQNIEYLTQMLHLQPQEKMMLLLLNAHVNNHFFRDIESDLLESDIFSKQEALELAAQVEPGCGFVFLKTDAPLRQFGLIENKRYDNSLRLTYWVRNFINTVHKNNEARYLAVLGNPLCAGETLCAKDFSYVEAASLALRLMKQANRSKGFNILLYGAPGTGKSSFAKLLARSAKLNLYPVGVCSGGEDEKNFRLQQFYRKQFLLKHIKNTCLLFDEGEDMFSSMETRTSKMEINNLLENNEVPVIWTTNKIHRMDPAYIRRFTLAVCFNKPPVEVRQKIWHKYLTENKIVCGKNDTLKLAKKYEVAPSMIAGAAQAARMAKGDLATVKDHLSFMTQALNGGYKKSKESQTEQEFFPELIHADLDLDLLTQQIKQLGRMNFSLCLYGASGTGKSAYARYLAEELNLEVMQRRASDLISPYVGETEQKIVRAFAEAKENKAMLIFDEADSFLRDRSTAMRSWEVSSVNEMLTWMENHPYPFICTTNLMDTLDPASLRRFSFKVKYDFLTLQQVCCSFMYFFRVMIEESDVAELTKLTPGDFMLVKNKAEILGKEHDFYALKQMLLDEQRLKQNRTGSGIGFHVA